MTADHKRALLTIEDDLILVEAATGVLHMVFKDLTEDGEDGSALAQSLFFVARNVEAACARIRETLGDEQIKADAPCVRHQEAAP